MTLQHASQGVEVILTEPEIGRTKYCGSNSVAMTATDGGTSNEDSTTAAVWVDVSSSLSSTSSIVVTTAVSEVLSSSSSDNRIGSSSSEVVDSISSISNNGNAGACRANHDYPSVNIFVAMDANADRFFQLFYKAFNITHVHVTLLTQSSSSS